MVLESLKLAFRYPLIKVGMIFLILALLLSLSAMYGIERKYEDRGVLGVGNYTLGNDEFEVKYYTYNRTLILSSNGSSFVFGNKTYSLNGSVVWIPERRPAIEVLSGNVSYDYTCRAKDYPLAPLSLLAFVFFLVGLVLSLQGYIKFIGDLRGRSVK